VRGVDGAVGRSYRLISPAGSPRSSTTIRATRQPSDRRTRPEEIDGRSRLFRKTDDDATQAASEHGHLPSQYELGPQLDEVVKQAAALPLEQFAEQLMTQFFTTEYMVGFRDEECLQR
jgi:hypothetical protein